MDPLGSILQFTRTHRVSNTCEHLAKKILSILFSSTRRGLVVDSASAQGTVAKDHFAIIQMLSENLGSYGALCRCCGFKSVGQAVHVCINIYIYICLCLSVDEYTKLVFVCKLTICIYVSVNVKLYIEKRYIYT